MPSLMLVPLAILEESKQTDRFTLYRIDNCLSTCHMIRRASFFNKVNFLAVSLSSTVFCKSSEYKEKVSYS